MHGIYNAQSRVLTVVIDNNVYTVDQQNVFFDKLMDAYREQNNQMFVQFYDEAEAKKALINSHKAKGVFFENDKLYFNGTEVHHSYAERISEAIRLKLPIEPMIKFFERLMQNPSAQSIEQLPDFLTHKNLPITEDGCFLAYKVVQPDMYSKASGKIELLQGKQSNGKVYNGVGEIIECPRRCVNDDRNQTCSYGLHIGGFAYSGPNGSYYGHGDTIIICKVDPKDVVSVPTDYNGQKMRVCKYEVIGIYRQPLNSVFENEEIEEEEYDSGNFQIFDEIGFNYLDTSTGEAQYREGIVQEIVNNDYVVLALLPDDPSYKTGAEIRKFKISLMDDICLLF